MRAERPVLRESLEEADLADHARPEAEGQQSTVSARGPLPRRRGKSRRLDGAALLAASNVVARACAFALIVVAARLLGTDDFAVVLLAQAAAQYLLILLDFGLTLTGIRMISADPPAVRSVMGSTLAIRVGVAFIGLLVVAAGAAIIVGGNAPVVAVAYSLVAVAASLDLSWVAQALGSTRLRSAVTAGSAMIGLALLLVALPQLRSPITVAVTQLAGISVAVGLGLVAVFRRYGTPTLPDVTTARAVVMMAVPLGLASLLAQVYYNMDLLLLGLWRPLSEVAIYGAVYKILLGLLMLVWTYAGVALPRLTSAFKQGSDSFSAELRRDLLTAVAFTTPLAVGIGVFAEPITVFLFGPEFAAGALPLRILLLSLPLAGFRTVLLYSFTASGRPWVVPLSSAPGALVNLTLNVLLIPSLGMIAAAITTVVAEAVVTGVALWQGRRSIRLMLAPHRERGDDPTRG